MRWKKGKFLFITLLLFAILATIFYFFFNKSVLANSQGKITITVKISVCGNNIKETGEQCDGSDLGGATCQSLGYSGGTLSCRPDCTFNTSGCWTGGGGGGGGGVYVPPPTTETKVVLQGKAYPLAKITILKDGEVAQITSADINANFKTEIRNISAGIWNFSLWAEDSKGRRSIIISFTVTILEGKTTTISNIFIPPTIELEKTKVAKGETLNIYGQTAPESQILIHVESPEEIIKTTMAKKTGDWDYPLDTSPLEEGMHTTRARAESPEGLKSAFSSVLAFYVGKYKPEEICPRADFNKDGRTNLIDFSILLYWWGKYNPCVDQNGDGIINLPDFSILLYYWTG
jgi:hypothetical protein